ncbi:MAG TPA: hypothetical protein VLV88_02755 [Terriglobales bacterium]|nr:hypothetical protein [Terriglobales bacterium]HUL14890.1 hypothetical protein [Terriglobales bacterium]
MSAIFLLGAIAALSPPASIRAQESQGPIAPPPDRTVLHRVDTSAPPPEAPPDLPPQEIIQRFSEKELEYAKARAGFGFKKTIRMTEYGLDGKPSGELEMTTQSVVGSDGWVSQRVVDQPVSTLHFMIPEPPDFDLLSKIPYYPLIPQQLPKYDIKYVGREKVDEIDCYIFEVKPKMVEREHPYFQGVVWVDTKYLEVVKTYGSYVNDLGNVHPQNLPFANFETYRENVEGKYWFPDYSRSDDDVHLKDRDVPVRLVIKWTDFKRLTMPAASASQPANPAPAPQSPQP